MLISVDKANNRLGFYPPYTLLVYLIVLTLVVQCAVIKGDVLDIMRDFKIHFSKLLFKLLVAKSIAGKIHKPCCFDIVTK